MAKFNAKDIDNYGGQGGGGYFSLKNDKDVAQVRFMYDSIDDVEGYAVHKCKVDDKDRWVNCLRAYNEPMDKCPFCKAGNVQTAKLFIPLYNIDQDKVQIWERGKKFYSTISGIFARARGSIVSHVFEIERNGKPKDTSTTYGIYDIDHDDTTLDDLPELPKILGGVLLDKSADDMEFYLDAGYFPPEDEEDEMPIRRRGSRNEEPRESREERPTRRTPANTRRRPGGNGNGDDEF